MGSAGKRFLAPRLDAPAAPVRHRYTGRLVGALRPSCGPAPGRRRPGGGAHRRPDPGSSAVATPPLPPVAAMLTSLPLPFEAAVRRAAALGFRHVDVVA